MTASSQILDLERTCRGGRPRQRAALHIALMSQRAPAGRIAMERNDQLAGHPNLPGVYRDRKTGRRRGDPSRSPATTVGATSIASSLGQAARQHAHTKRNPGQSPNGHHEQYRIGSEQARLVSSHLALASASMLGLLRSHASTPPQVSL